MVSTGDMSSIYRRPAELLQRLIRFDTTNPHTCYQALVQSNGASTLGGLNGSIIGQLINPKLTDVVLTLLGGRAVFLTHC